MIANNREPSGRPAKYPARTIAAIFARDVSAATAKWARRESLTMDVLRDALGAQRDMLIRDIIARMRHDGCGGRAGKVELLTGSRIFGYDKCNSRRTSRAAMTRGTVRETSHPLAARFP